MSKRSVVIGFGSNIDPLKNLRQALAELKKIPTFKVIKLASIYESEALLPENANLSWNQTYLNSAVLIDVEAFDPFVILKKIKEIEVKLLRNNTERWSPRTIDLDILWVDQFELNSKELKIPHADLGLRAFALAPLLEIYPDLKKLFPDFDLMNFKLKTEKSKKFIWPEMVGIINLTQDSFSDGGLLNTTEQIEQKFLQHLNHGAEVLDIGAESTRPGSIGVETEIEIDALQGALKIIESLKQKFKFKVSVDCRKPEVLRQIILKYNLDYINDVEGFRSAEMINLLKDCQAKAVCMHAFSVPPINREFIPETEDIFKYFTTWWEDKLTLFEKSNIDLNRVIFDPGIGFGKTPEQSFNILENLGRFNLIKNDIYLGYSRKSFLQLKTKNTPSLRDPETAQITQGLNLAYAQHLRVHNVKINKEAITGDLNL